MPCPKCGRLLVPSGELTIGDAVLPVYQCDECLLTRDVMGRPFELALTFTLDANGRPADPATGEPFSFPA